MKARPMAECAAQVVLDGRLHSETGVEVEKLVSEGRKLVFRGVSTVSVVM